MGVGGDGAEAGGEVADGVEDEALAAEVHQARGVLPVGGYPVGGYPVGECVWVGWCGVGECGGWVRAGGLLAGTRLRCLEVGGGNKGLGLGVPWSLRLGGTLSPKQRKET